MEPYVRQQADDRNHVVIIELGTNDAMLGNPAWRSDYTSALQDVADTSCVVLVSVPLAADTFYEDTHNGSRLDIAKQLDDLIASTALQQPNVRVVHYAQHVRNTPGFSSDGIHPTSIASQAWLADQYKAAADSCPP